MCVCVRARDWVCERERGRDRERERERDRERERERERESSLACGSRCGVSAQGSGFRDLQGYLAHKKTPTSLRGYRDTSLIRNSAPP